MEGEKDVSKLLTKIRETHLPADTKPVAHRAAVMRAWMHSERMAKIAFFAVLALVATYLAALIGAESALAQGTPGGSSAPSGGGQYQGDAIHTTLENVRNYIASILLILGGIGFAVSLGLKAIAGPNENMHHAAHLGMKGSGIAVLDGAMIVPIMNIIESLAAATGGGGG